MLVTPPGATKGRSLQWYPRQIQNHCRTWPRKVKLTCHNCQSVAYKFGFFKGWQRFRCKTCGRTFTDIPKRPLDELRVEPAKAYQVITLLCEGLGVRAIERITNLSRRTVLSILKTAGEKCARLLDSKIRDVECESVQCDELFAFVYCKERNNVEKLAWRGEQYTWLAIDRKSKLILSHLVAKRDREPCDAFMMDLRKRVKGRFQLTTDGYTGYLTAVLNAFWENVDFAQQMKQFGNRNEGRKWERPGDHRRYSPDRCTAVHTDVRIGCPNPGLISTSHVERLNLNVRLFNRRFTRLTLGYSKKLANLKHSVALMIAYHNFVRQHSAHGLTPAQAAGITDRKWTVSELFQAIA